MLCSRVWCLSVIIVLVIVVVVVVVVVQVNLDMTDHCTTDFSHMTDDMLGPSPMHIKYSSYVYDGFCIRRTNFPGPIESVISEFTCSGHSGSKRCFHGNIVSAPWIGC